MQTLKIRKLRGNQSIVFFTIKYHSIVTVKLFPTNLCKNFYENGNTKTYERLSTTTTTTV